MKKPNISHERLKYLFSYDPETGYFTRLVKTQNSAARIIAGSPNNKSYINIGIDGKVYSAHRLAFFYMTGEWPKDEIDHVNNIRNDNRWCNLREATRKQNCVNRKGYGGTGIKGVHKTSKGKFVAQIRLGTFDTIEEAEKVYNEAASKLHGEFFYILSEGLKNGIRS